jgi:hypothetical protein
MPGTKRLHTTDLGKEGDWLYDASDVTSADEGALVLVDASGRRWKRILGDTIQMSWWGIVPNLEVDQSAQVQKAFTASKGRTLWVPLGFFRCKNITTVDSMTINGPGTFRTDNSATYAANDFLIKISHNKGVNVLNIKLDGNAANVAGNTQAGVTLLLMSVDSNTFIQNITCFNSFFLGVRPVKCYNTKVIGCNFFNIDTGVLPNGGNNGVTVSDCYFNGGTSEGVTPGGAYNSLIIGSITTQNLNPTSGAATAGSFVSGGTLTDGNTITDYAVTVSGVYTGQLTFQYSLNGGTSWITDSAVMNYAKASQLILPTSGDTSTYNVDFYGFPATTQFRVSANGSFTGTAALQIEPFLADRNITITGNHVRNKQTSAAFNLEYCKNVTISGNEVDSCKAAVLSQPFQNAVSNITVSGNVFSNCIGDAISGPFVNSTFNGNTILNAGRCGIWGAAAGLTAATTHATNLKIYNFNNIYSNNTIVNPSTVLVSKDGIRLDNSVNCRVLSNIVIDNRPVIRLNSSIAVYGPNSNTNYVMYNTAPNNVITTAVAANTYIEGNSGQVFDQTGSTGTIVKSGYGMGSTSKTISTDSNLVLNLRGDVYALTSGSAQTVDSIQTTAWFGRLLTFVFTGSNITFISSGNMRINGGAFTGATTTPLSVIYDGTNWIQAGGSSGSAVVGANPSQSVGTSAVNGSATTFMRSDAAPALSQAIVPTWTGAHTFANKLSLSLGQGTHNALRCRRSGPNC